MYHSAATARDRDRLRQSVLEHLGWTIHHIWSRDWYENSEREIEKVLKLVDAIINKQDSPEIVNAYKQEDDSPDDLFNKLEENQEDKKSILKDSFESTKTLPPGISYYQPTHYLEIGNGVYGFNKASSSLFRSVIEKIVNKEGPIQIELLRKRVASAWGIKKVGVNIERTIDTAIRGAIQYKQIIRKENFLWPLDMEIPPIRIPESDDQKRSIDEISLEELAEGAFLCVDNALSISPDDLLKETARLFGLRLSDKTNKRIIKSIKLLEKKHRVEWRADKIRIPQN